MTTTGTAPAPEPVPQSPWAPDIEYGRTVDRTVGRALRVVSSDADRLAGLLGDVEVRVLEGHIESLTAFVARITESLGWAE